MLARKKGLLALASIDSELKKDPFLARSVQLVTDGYTGEDVDRILGQEVDALVERHRQSAGIVRRASEIAPAMGLIGTLVGLVQMLAELENPSAIGPAMALALLTTFYGAIMGTVVLGPLAAKLERNKRKRGNHQNKPPPHVLKTLKRQTKAEKQRKEKVSLIHIMIWKKGEK